MTQPPTQSLFLQKVKLIHKTRKKKTGLIIPTPTNPVKHERIPKKSSETKRTTQLRLQKNKLKPFKNPALNPFKTAKTKEFAYKELVSIRLRPPLETFLTSTILSRHYGRRSNFKTDWRIY